MLKQLIIFDLDGTLAESKASLDAEMGTLLSVLLGVAKVAVISGGNWAQFERQLLPHLPEDDRLNNLFLLPTCGTQFFQFSKNWQQLYAEDFTKEEKALIIGALQEVIRETGHQPKQVWGEVIEDRGSQITFSALGQEAPLAQKELWDPQFE
jgi:hypothetical protein